MTQIGIQQPAPLATDYSMLSIHIGSGNCGRIYIVMITSKLLIDIPGWAGVLLVVFTLSLGAYATTGFNVVWVAIGILTLGRKWLTRN